MLSGSPTTVTTDFTKIGINSIQNKVAEVVWNLGGCNGNAYANEIYERGEAKCAECIYNTTWEGKVALAYPSDKAYGADLSSCSSSLNDYINCNSVNWMLSMSNGTALEWLLTPSSSVHDYACSVNFRYVYYYYGVDFGIGTRPTFYLDASQNILYGDGSEDNPYVIN